MAGKRANGRSRLLDAALGVFLESGFDSATIQVIADRAGVAKSLLHYHFRGKDELLAACLEGWLDEAERLVDLLERSRADAEVVLTAYLDTAMRWQGPIRLANLDLAVRQSPGVGPRVEQLQHRWRRLVSDDDVAASATLGVLTRPIVQLGDGRVVQDRIALVKAATTVLTALDPGHATD